MFLIWLVLLIGIEIGIRTETPSQLFSITSTNKLRLYCYFLSWIVSFLIYFFDLSAFVSWYLVMLALILLPTLKILIKHSRKSQIPTKSLSFLDLILLNMKSGQSFRKSLGMTMDSEKSWFNRFQLSLVKSLESGTLTDTESDWFNKWSQEIVSIEKSRSKVIEQLEILRRYNRQELNFKKKMQNASAGPRAQVFVMSLLFVGLNFVAFRSLDSQQVKSLLPIAWFLYSLGIATIFLIMRSFKWKV